LHCLGDGEQRRDSPASGRYPAGCRLGATATSSLASGIALLYTMVVPCPAPRTRWAQEVAMLRFWLGVLATLVTGAVGVLAFLGLGLMPVSADAKPGAFESWLAGFARDAAIERAAPERQSPVAATPENLAAAALLYRDNCAGCHGTPDAKENVFGASLYPPAPQFLSATARENLPDSDGEIFVGLPDGIRFPAMPTCAHMLKDEDLWRLVVFLKHLDDLPPAAVSTLSAR